MEQPQTEPKSTRASTRLHSPHEKLSPAAQEALERRSLAEHQAAIDNALRRR